MTLVDTNVLADVVTQDVRWAAWSLQQLEAASLRGSVCINDVIYAEIAVRFARLEDLDATLETAELERRPMSRYALFLAGKAFELYRRNGGPRSTLLPDLFIGAQAAAEGITLLTRDARRYRTYFPSVELITPQI